MNYHDIQQMLDRIESDTELRDVSEIHRSAVRRRSRQKVLALAIPSILVLAVVGTWLIREPSSTVIADAATPAGVTTSQTDETPPPTTELDDAGESASGTETDKTTPEGFTDLSHLITETVEYAGPTGQAVTLIPESPDSALPFELSLTIGEWTESYRQDGALGEVELSQNIAYSFEIAYACSQTSGWLTHIEGSTFQWQGGFTPTGDEPGEDCDIDVLDVPFTNDLLANADNLELNVINKTLSLSFGDYEATWIPRTTTISEGQ